MEGVLVPNESEFGACNITTAVHLEYSSEIKVMIHMGREEQKGEVLSQRQGESW